MTADDLTAIRRDLARYEALAAMSTRDYLAAGGERETTAVRDRLVRAVPRLVARVEALETIIAKIRSAAFTTTLTQKETDIIARLSGI